MSERPKIPKPIIPRPIRTGTGAGAGSAAGAAAGGAGAGAAAAAMARPGVLSLTIKDKSALHAAYMPYVKGGGIFMPSNRSYKLGDEVFMLLTLMENKEKIPVAGRVVWVTPNGAHGGKTAGIGVQFSEKDSGVARNKIEALLAGLLNSDRQTHTM